MHWHRCSIYCSGIFTILCYSIYLIHTVHNMYTCFCIIHDSKTSSRSKQKWTGLDLMWVVYQVTCHSPLIVPFCIVVLGQLSIPGMMHPHQRKGSELVMCAWRTGLAPLPLVKVPSCRSPAQQGDVMPGMLPRWCWEGVILYHWTGQSRARGEGCGGHMEM